LFKPFRLAYAKGKAPALKKIGKEILGVTFQENEHCSVEDARMCMLIYRRVRRTWESSVYLKEHEKSSAAQGQWGNKRRRGLHTQHGNTASNKRKASNDHSQPAQKQAKVSRNSRKAASFAGTK
jgi:hypothetical protein